MDVETRIIVRDKKKRKLSKLPEKIKEEVKKEMEFFKMINKFFEKTEKMLLTNEDESIFKQHINKLFSEYKTNERKILFFDIEKKKKIKILDFEFFKDIDANVRVVFEIILKEA